MGEPRGVLNDNDEPSRFAEARTQPMTELRIPKRTLAELRRAIAR
jgi:hypothetical protein